ncbi:hypothetical protein [Pararhodobacter zhoushanensis]|uniref:Oligosaccharide repeat unit polymerase n=1 Tax=Pararhodobacter zhoushanensis TaxID=2479545 RepID=A0ABT3H260_9RHOB|nr:hypothetical protein [Pararhodobacter zhoushanensis]MCW1933778.1 hypothetical protein [Pararhodobacter zhoushanensis]
MEGLIISWILMLYGVLRRDQNALVLASLPVVMTTYFIVGTRVFQFATDMPFTFYDEAKAPVYDTVLLAMALHFLAIYLGIRTKHWLIRDRAVIERRLTLKVFGLSRFLNWPYAFVIAAPIFFILMAVDFSSLLARQGFVPDSLNGSWMRFADITFWLSAFALPFLRAATLRYIILFSVAFLFTLLGSRSGPIYILVYVMIERFIIGDRSATRHLVLTALPLYLLAIIIDLRATNDGGMAAIISKMLSIQFSDLLDALLYSINYILSFSVVSAAEVIYSVTAEARWFYYSILPLPSSLYDLSAEYDLNSRFRTNIPYSGFGYALQFLGLTLYSLLVGATAFCYELFRGIFATRRDMIEKSLFYASLLVPFLVMLQYNLRTSSRLIYVFIALYFLFAIGRRIRFHLPGTRRNLT